MTKNEAIELMQKGVKIKHTSFLDNEWMTIEGIYMIFDDGMKIEYAAFWHDMTAEVWDNGYSVFEQ